MKLSIIIPVYNVERYLRQCLDSCLDQDIPKTEYEIIVVNDGSPDNAQDIIDEYAAKYDNIKVIKKKNGGLSSARNAGLKIAKGDYIWFVDSDDWVARVLDSLTKEIVLHKNADVLCFNTYMVIEEVGEVSYLTRSLRPNGSYDGLSVFKAMKFPYSAVQFNLWKRNFLIDKKLTFKEGALYDDWQFLLRAYALMNECIYISKPIYYYRLRQNTISTSAKTFRNMKDCVETACDYNAFLKSRNLKKNDKKMLTLGICCMLNDAFKLSMKDTTKIERIQYLAYFFSKNIWLDSLKKKGTFKNWIAYIIMYFTYKFKI